MRFACRSAGAVVLLLLAATDSPGAARWLHTPRNPPQISPPTDRAPITAALEVWTNQPLGDLPRLFRPSAMLTASDDAAKQALAGLPGALGAVRWGISRLLYDNRTSPQFMKVLRAMCPSLKTLAGRGADVVVCIEGTPWWLSSRQETGPAGTSGWALFETSPPSNASDYQDFVFETVRLLEREAGSGLSFEFWNEPNSLSFWRGTRAELFSTYDAFVRGARRADAGARVGGIAVGSWENPLASEPTGSPPLLQSFIQHAGVSGTAPDFVSWHAYASGAEDRWEGAWEIRRWLAEAGLAAELPQVVDEWNLWSTFPDPADPARDGLKGAAFLSAGLFGMDRAGIAEQTVSTLQDFSDPRAGEVFTGDFGLLTRSPMVKKASFHLWNLLALMSGSRVRVDLPADVADLEGVGALATSTAGHVALLVGRLAGDPGGAVLRLLQRDGYRSFHDLGITRQQVIDYYLGTAALPAGAPLASRAAVEAAVSRVRTGWASEVALQISVPGLSPPLQYSIYRIDADHLNPGDAFARALAQGLSPDQALAAARALERFEPAESGTGALPEIRFGLYGATLVTLASAAP